MKFTKMVKTALWSLLLVLFATSAANAAVTLEGCPTIVQSSGLSTILCSQEDAEDGSTIITVTSKPNSTQYLEDLKYSYSVPIIVNGKLNTLSMMGSLVENQTPLDGKYTLTVDKTKSVTFKATFANKSQQSLTLQANFGRVLYATTSTTPVKKDFGEYAIDALPVSSGDIAYVTLKPNPGYKVSGVLATYMNGSLTEGGSLKTVQVYEAGNDKYYFRMPAYSLNVKATFDYVDYTISKPTVTGGTYTVTTANGKTTAIVGEKVTVKPTPKQTDTEAYIVNTTDGVSYDVGDGVSHIIIGTNGEYSFYMPASDVTINVKFTQLKKVTIEHEGEGTAEIETTPTWTSPNGVNFYKGTPLFGAKAAQGYYVGHFSVAGLSESSGEIEETLSQDNSDQNKDYITQIPIRLSTSMFNGSAKVVFKKQDLAITNEIASSHCQVEELRSTAQVGDDVSFKVSCDDGYGMDAVALYNATMKVPVDGGTTLDKGTGYYHFTMPEIPVLIRGTAKYGITVVDDNPGAETAFLGMGAEVFDPNLKFVAGGKVIVYVKPASDEVVSVYYSYMDAEKVEQSVHLEMKTASWDVDPVNPWLEATFEMPAAPVTVKVERAKKHGITIIDDNPGAETEFYGKKPADFDPDLKFVAGEMVTVNAKSVSGEPVNVYYSYVDAVKGKQTVQLEMEKAGWDMGMSRFPWLEAVFEMPDADVTIQVARSQVYAITIDDKVPYNEVEDVLLGSVAEGTLLGVASDDQLTDLDVTKSVASSGNWVAGMVYPKRGEVIKSVSYQVGENAPVALENMVACDETADILCPWTIAFEMPAYDVKVIVERENIQYKPVVEGADANCKIAGLKDGYLFDENVEFTVECGKNYTGSAALVCDEDDICPALTESEGKYSFKQYLFNMTIKLTYEKTGDAEEGDEGGETLPKFYNIGKTIVKNGKITVDGEMPAGETVTFKAVPNEGYVVDVITITKTGDSKTKVTSKTVSGKKDTYKFTMPEYDVTISVTFKAAEVEGEEDGDDEDSDDEKSEYVVASVSVPQFSVIASGRSLQISGVRAGSDIAVFSMQGKLIKKMRAQVSTIETVLPNAGSYMVKVGNAAKVVNVR